MRQLQYAGYRILDQLIEPVALSIVCGKGDDSVPANQFDQLRRQRRERIAIGMLDLSRRRPRPYVRDEPVPSRAGSIFLFLIETFIVDDGFEQTAKRFRLCASPDHKKKIGDQTNNRFGGEVLRLVFLAKRNLPVPQRGSQLWRAAACSPRAGDAVRKLEVILIDPIT